ncbi:NAD(P)/FAD-dependent oxidoreductase [Agrococcus carbonis]|uniref:Thioredoxin reductase n=1 Tax=Agrococcus carbonis TaxID=684552 RepID=A0A1H1PRX5_9MICO|nr:NAD(P)/FAD-dependent oxidoreductase [Agrococcus carbonis]SDS13509.1 Thioredoxin reductase [Agrococcus carbonis]
MHPYDVIVIGGGPAGLQAALTLGRMRRRVALIDGGSYRNDPAHAMQNLIGHDGHPPAELRAAARAELARYATVEVVEARVADLAGEADAFRVALEDGRAPEARTVLTARRLLLATGAADALPDIPGVAELFGDRIAHCPYCHGFELADGPIAFLGLGPHTPAQAALVARLATRRLVLLDGADAPAEVREQLDRMGVEVVPERVLAVRAHADGLEVALDRGQDDAEADALVLTGMFVAPGWSQAAPFAEQLGLERAPTGATLVDSMGRTSLDGVAAAGDAAQPRSMPGPMSSVASSIASGQVAAATLDRELAMLDAGIPLPV